MAASDVRVASPATGTGGILAAPSTTATLPTDTAATIPAPFVKGGYVGEDGLTMTVARTSEKIRAWGGDAVRTVQTEHDVTFAWQFLETNEFTAAAVFHEDNVTATPASASAGTLLAIKVDGKPLPPRAWVFDMVDGDAKIRVVVPNGQITEVGDTTFVHTNATGYEVTLEALPDEDGVKAFIYTDDGVTTA